MLRETISLNGLKGIGAVIIAFFYHYGHFTKTYNCSFPFSDIGIASVLFESGSWFVELFFMISGFGMMLTYSKRILNGEIQFWEYMKKRLLKIYPIFCFTLFITAFLETIIWRTLGTTWMYINDLYHFIQNLFLVQTGFFGVDFSFNGPAWCISITMFCYVWFYLLLYKVKSIEKANRYLLVAVGVSLIIFSNNINYPIFNTCMAEGVGCFSIGIFLAQFYEKKERLNYRGIYSLAMLIIGIVGSVRLFFPNIILAGGEKKWCIA